ncbi:SDR family oxidoreductase [Acetobacteraceae bacterium]|nr:SDR family oxidoreductase [Acetobacteraceae bacterium]
MSQKRNWLITGASSGFGKSLAQKILAEGDNIVVTARKKEALEEIAKIAPDRVFVFPADITVQSQREALVKASLEHFSKIDMLANVAGRGCVGEAEAFSQEEMDALMALNFIAPVELIKLVLPAMRQQKSGKIINFTSIAGMVSFPACAPYSATKYALEGWTDALRQEVSQFNIEVMLVEPGAFKTEFAVSGVLMEAQKSLPAYDEMLKYWHEFFEKMVENAQGDPDKAADVILKAVSGKMSSHLLLGSDAYETLDHVMKERLTEIAHWKEKGAANTSFKNAKEGASLL